MPATESATGGEFDFELDDFFSNPEPAAGPDAAAVASPMAGDSPAGGEGDDSVVVTADPDEMFSDTAGNLWPVAGEGASGEPPADRDHRLGLDHAAEDRDSTPLKRPIWLMIVALEHELGDVCREEERLKALVKSAKENRIAIVEKLEELCREQDNPTPAPAASLEGQGTSSLAGLTSASSGAVTAPQGGEAWGREPIEVLGSHRLKPAKVEGLRKAADKGKFGGDVVGLRDWIAKYDLWHLDVPGCGPKGADAIIDALTSYVAANPMADEPLTPEDEARHVAAAEWLGHTTSPTDTDALARAEAAMPSGEALRGLVNKFTAACSLDGLEASVDPTATKKFRKPRAAKITPMAGYHAEPADSTPAPAQPSSPAGEAEAAYLAGCDAGAAGASCSENPFADRSSAEAREWQRGWDECSV